MSADNQGRSDRRPVVVLTRSADNNRELARRLAEQGLDSLSAPMIEVAAPVDGGNALVAAVANLDHYHWLVVTSVNGVKAVGTAMEKVGMSRWPAHLKLAAVGPATAQAARDWGWPVDFIPRSATGNDLARQFPDPVADALGTPVRVLAALAEKAALTVAKGLRGKGYQVDQVEAYRTVAPEPSEELARAIERADAITFSSPSTVDRWLSRYGRELIPPVVICIGPRTAKRAKVQSLQVTQVADPHTEDGLVAALVDHLAGR